MTKKRVVVTGSRPGSDAWVASFRATGARPYYFPTITVASVKRSATLVRVLRTMPRFDWVIFTSANALRFLHKTLKGARITITPRQMPRCAVIGEQTADAARKAGIRVVFRPTRANSEALARELTPVRGRSILLLRTTIASPMLVNRLVQRGAKVTDLPIYQTKVIRRPDATFSKLLRDGNVGCVTFASPSAVEGFCARVPKWLLPLAKNIPAVSIGPKVTASLKRAGFRHTVQAKKPTIEAVVGAMRGRGLY